MSEIINHDNPKYRERWNKLHGNRFNGAFYYSKEICKYMIPNVETTRNWITVNVPGVAFDHSIVFIHNNLYPEHYDWLAEYKDLILVCGIKETQSKVKHLGRTIVLPLSIDVEYVKQFETEKTKETAFVGRASKRIGSDLPRGIDIIEGVPRNVLLARMAEYRNVYAVGRTAIEAKALGCKVLPYDPRFPNPRRWKVLDSLDAAKLLQERLNRLDK